jgi:1,2-diacylglycerol 3-alpha-glucosyltransferase
MQNRPLRIAMVVASPFPANHGTPGSIREMTEAVAARGHDVHVVTYHFGEGPNPKSVHIHRIPDLGFSRRVVVGPTWERPLLDLLMVFTLCRVILREDIDLIHAHNYEGALVGYGGRLITGRPLVYNAVNMMSDELLSYNFFRPEILGVWLASLLDYCVPRMADRIVAISNDLVRMLRIQGVKSDRLRMIPLGIDTGPFREEDPSPVRERYALSGSPLVMYTGILDRLQRTDYLLRAMQIVVQKVPDARLLLVVTIAKDKDLQECRRMIKELNLEDRVAITVNTHFEEIPSYLAAADVAVVCRPRCPGFPVKVLNYMAAGKPIVAFEGSAKGLGHMTSAFVVDDDDWRGLAHGIVTLLQNPKMAAGLGENAREWVETNLAWPRITCELESVYYGLLEHRKIDNREAKVPRRSDGSMI